MEWVSFTVILIAILVLYYAAKKLEKADNEKGK